MSWVQTYTGRQFWPLDPRPEDVDLRDIAHSLAMQCRFNGHCRRFYSVAEHSVLVSEALPHDLQAWGLMHDAAEAYIGDHPRPIKTDATKAVEERLLGVIAERFGLPWPIPPEVFEADLRMLATEARYLMGPPPASWGLDAEPYGPPLYPTGLSHTAAEYAFLRRARLLKLEGTKTAAFERIMRDP